MKTFAEGIDELKRMVGSGMLQGTISVNQVYAHYQDSGHGPAGKPAEEFNHPRGGEAHYLSGQIVTKKEEVISRWANNLLNGRLVSETIDMVATMRTQTGLRAPREFDILRHSVEGKVTDDGPVVFFEPALVPRLSEIELKTLRRQGYVSRVGVGLKTYGRYLPSRVRG